MKEYKINALQYHVLPVFLCLKQKDMAQAIGVSENKMTRHLRDGDFKVTEALIICNTYHIMLSQFVTTNKDEQLCSISQCPDVSWKELSFCSKKLLSRIRKGELTYVEITRTTGYARATLDNILAGNCTMSQLLIFCNRLRMNLSDFICDPTLPLIEYSTIKEKNLALERENKRLREIIEKMKPYVPEELRMDVVAER